MANEPKVQDIWINTTQTPVNYPKVQDVYIKTSPPPYLKAIHIQQLTFPPPANYPKLKAAYIYVPAINTVLTNCKLYKSKIS